MAQYGKNFYGASYYGMSGTLGGQYTSEETFTGNPLTGSMTATVVGILPRSLYLHNDYTVFSYAMSPGSFTNNGTTYSMLSNNNSVTIEYVGSDFTLIYLKHPNGAKFNITVNTYVDGELVDTIETSVDTNNTTAVESSFNANNLQFGTQVVVVSRDVASSPSHHVFLRGISARTTDFTLQIRAKIGENGSWTEWNDIELTRAVLPGIADLFQFTGNTQNLSGKNYYQFRLYLGTSDSNTSPIIRSCKFASGNTSNYAKSGKYRMRVDLVGASQLHEVLWNADIPEGTSIKIRTRTAATEPLVDWTSWSAPYSDANKRIRLKSNSMPQSNNPISGYIITPLLNPQNPEAFVTLRSWIELISKQYITDQNTSITYEILDQNMQPLTYIDQVERYMRYTYTSGENIIRNISEASNRPIRVKISINRNAGYYSSPVVDLLQMRSKALYEEVKAFSPQSQYKSYGSAVYGANTGLFNVTFGDTDYPGDGTLVKPSNLSFTIPTPIGDINPVIPEYFIDEVDYQGLKPGEELTLYWKNVSDSASKETKTIDPDDILVAHIKAWPNNSLTKAEAKVIKHYQYGRGYIIWPSTVETIMTNAFQSPIQDNSQYSYCLVNGWTTDIGVTNRNENIVLSWKSQSNSPVTEISEMNGSRKNSILYNDTVIISVNEASVQGEITWTSEEKIFSATVNDNGIKSNKIIELTRDQLPTIPPEVNIGYNPYHVEIVYRSVTENGRIVPSDRLVVLKEVDGEVIQEYPNVSYDEDSFEVVTATKRPVIRNTDGMMDALPNSRVLDVTGIFRTDLGQSQAGYYVKGMDFQVIGNYIDWSIAYDEDGNLKNGRQAPDPGTTYYVSYTYEDVVKILVEFQCDYKEKDTIRTLWTSDTTIRYEGVCSPGHDFRSNPLPSKLDENVWGEIPPNVDRDTLFYVIHDNNVWVSTFLDTNDNDDPIVVGTLRNRVPSINWFPKVTSGYYYIGKDEYYYFTEPTVFKPTDEDVEQAKNVTYIPGKYGNGIFIGEGTANLVSNSNFVTASKNVVFSDTFTRQE